LNIVVLTIILKVCLLCSAPMVVIKCRSSVKCVRSLTLLKLYLK